jgi:hypothetical protein
MIKESGKAHDRQVSEEDQGLVKQENLPIGKILVRPNIIQESGEAQDRQVSDED